MRTVEEIEAFEAAALARINDAAAELREIRDAPHRELLEAQKQIADLQARLRTAEGWVHYYEHRPPPEFKLLVLAEAEECGCSDCEGCWTGRVVASVGQDEPR